MRDAGPANGMSSPLDEVGPTVNPCCERSARTAAMVSGSGPKTAANEPGLR